MIRREHKALKFFLVGALSIMVTWQGKNNLAWFVSQAIDRDCSANWLLIKCK